jgi:hypothetical protein
MIGRSSLLKIVPGLLLICSTTACLHPEGPGAKTVAEKFGEPYQGFRSSPPELLDKNRRLDVFLGVPEETEEDESLDAPVEYKDVIYCVALNDEKRPLPEVFKLISEGPADKLIFIWGAPVSKKKQWWWDGITCEAKAIAVWHPKARRYIYFDVSYGTPVLKWRNIRRALKIVVEKGAKAAL